MWPRAVVCVVAVTCCAVGAWAAPDDLELRIDNGPRNKKMKVVLGTFGGNAAAEAATDAAGRANLLLNIGNMGKAQVKAVSETCPDGSTQLAIVEPDHAQACQGGRTRRGCECREGPPFDIGPGQIPGSPTQVGVDWTSLLMTGRSFPVGPVSRRPPAEPEEPTTGMFSRGFIMGGGGEWGYYPNRECRPVEGFRSTACNLDKTALDFTLGAEYGILENLAIGASFDRTGPVTLERDIQSIATPSLTAELRNGVFDPRIWTFNLQPSWPISPGHRLWIFGRVGLAAWKARSGNTTTFLVNGRQVDRSVTAQEDSGFAPVFGAGLRYWQNERFGFSAGYQRIKLTDEAGGVDVLIHGVKLEFNLRIGGAR